MNSTEPNTGTERLTREEIAELLKKLPFAGKRVSDSGAKTMANILRAQFDEFNRERGAVLIKWIYETYPDIETIVMIRLYSYLWKKMDKEFRGVPLNMRPEPIDIAKEFHEKHRENGGFIHILTMKQYRPPHKTTQY